MSEPLQPVDGWMIAQLRPNGGGLARRNLERQGFAVLTPVLEVSRRFRNRLVTRDEPLFPGYLFVRETEGSASPVQVSHTLGISRLLLRPDRRPATLPRGFVAAIWQQIGNDGRLSSQTELTPGQQVRVTQGPFAETLSRVAGLERDGRVSVLIGLLGQDVAVSLPRGHLTTDTYDWP